MKIKFAAVLLAFLLMSPSFAHAANKSDTHITHITHVAKSNSKKLSPDCLPINQGLKKIQGIGLMPLGAGFLVNHDTVSLFTRTDGMWVIAALINDNKAVCILAYGINWRSFKN